jgi:hydrogenase expression/formation protein HypD
MQLPPVQLVRQIAPQPTLAVVSGGIADALDLLGPSILAAMRSQLPAQIRLISGPGCPVCVTPNGYLDRAIALCRRPETIITTTESN